MLPTLKELVSDYNNAHCNARDPEVMLLFATLFKVMGQYLQSYLKDVVFQLCESTLEIIKNDMISFPEYRQAFFKLI